MIQPVIGILGGTFDPIHFGHLRTALEVAEYFAVDAMHLIPGNVPPHRPAPQAAAHHRLAMLQAAVAPETALLADARELQRSGHSYTVHTLEALRVEYGPDCALLLTLGLDAFRHFRTWHRWERILSLAHLVVAQRPGYSLPPDAWYQPSLAGEAAALRERPYGRIHTLTVTPLDISATQIRHCFQHRKNPRYLLPDPVIDYIYTHQLYCGA